jgi:ferredoxin-NADP reductase
MAEPQIVPPTPTINQGTDPGAAADAALGQSVQTIFDRIMPPAKGEEPPKPPPPPQEAPKPPVTPPETPPAPTEPVPPPTQIPTSPEPERKLPSFIEQALKVEPAEPSAAPVDELPENLDHVTPEEHRKRWQSFRGAFNALKEENKTLKNRPPIDEPTRARLEYLENENKTMSQRLNQFSIETNQDFQQNVIQPMQGAWYKAARIMQEAGGDPKQLAKAMSVSGLAQYQALDDILSDLPESAKAEVNNALTAYRQLDEVRQNALKDAPRTVRELNKRNMERQVEFINKQKSEMGVLFDEAVRKLRDEAGVEVLRRTDDPESAWWNQQGDELVKTARNLYLDNADLGRMAMACVLAPMADTYRKLWFQEREARVKAEGTLKEKFGAEPSLSESGGAVPVPGAASMRDDLKRPFDQVFLDKFHELQRQGR